MGLFNRFKKHKKDDSNVPYLPDDGSLPPLPPLKGKDTNDMDLPPLPKKPHRVPPRGSAVHSPVPRARRPQEVADKEWEKPDLKSDSDRMPALPKLKPYQDEKKTKEKTPPKVTLSKKKAKVFVQLEKYKDIVQTVGNMESSISDLQDSIAKIKEIRSEENKMVDNWNSLLQKAKGKIEQVNRNLPEAEE